MISIDEVQAVGAVVTRTRVAFVYVLFTVGACEAGITLADVVVSVVDADVWTRTGLTEVQLNFAIIARVAGDALTPESSDRLRINLARSFVLTRIGRTVLHAQHITVFPYVTWNAITSIAAILCFTDTIYTRVRITRFGCDVTYPSCRPLRIRTFATSDVNQT
jgi:hypothetical protein